MGLTSALYTGLSGLNSNQQRIDTIGDNIANVNTTAFKSSRSMFQTQFSQTLSQGTPPSPSSGGTNPMQIGLGSLLGSIQRTFTPGSIETTGVPTDLAIDGTGFFVVQTAEGSRYYTRDGSFKLSASNYLVNQNGAFVQGYAVDSDYNIIPGTIGNLLIPVGAAATARPTENVEMSGNLFPGEVGTRGTILFSQPLTQAGGAAATSGTLLTNLYDPAVSVANPLFAVGDEVTLSKVKKGERDIPTATFTVTATSTLADFLNFLSDKAAIDTTNSPVNHPGWWVSDGSAPDPANPTAGQEARAVGVPPAGTIVIEGNIGRDNRLSIKGGAIASTNANNKDPFAFTIPTDALDRPYEANGDSAYTSLLIYDSLGTEVRVDLTAVLESKADTGNAWRFFASSKDDSDSSRVLRNGRIAFTTEGKYKSATNDQITLDRAGTGAATPLVFALDFSNMTAFSSHEAISTFLMSNQDGFPAGTLTSFSIGNDGIISGNFTNGLTRTLGQVAMATFSNPEGLVAMARNLYIAGPNSGIPVITAPMTLGAGRILGGSLELSNVDLSREFIGLITATTGFSAASRVISTSNDLLNQLLSVAR